jgi:hypothetical protein
MVDGPFVVLLNAGRHHGCKGSMPKMMLAVIESSAGDACPEFSSKTGIGDDARSAIIPHHVRRPQVHSVSGGLGAMPPHPFGA